MKKLVNYIVLSCALFTSSVVFAGSGACCLNGDVCYDTMNEVTCQIFGGVWYPGFDCASVTCETNCGGNCSPGESEDCFGHCFPVAWIGDGYCDDGSYQWDTYNIYLNCEEFGYDGGDCESPPDLPVSAGACCLGGFDACDRVCEDLTYADCVASNGQFIGEGTICTDATCTCPPGMIADCNGNCFPLHYLNDGLCHDGHSYPENGDDAGAYELSLGCFELVCDLNDCLGVCLASCCVEVECVEDMTPLECAGLGGTFLGGGEDCSDVDCSNYLVPVRLTVELEGIGAYVEGHNTDRVDTKDGVVVIALGNCLTFDGDPVSVVNVYNGQEFAQSFVEWSDGEMPYVATDGQRIVMAVQDRIAVFELDETDYWQFEYEFIAVGGAVRSVAIDGDRIVTTRAMSYLVDIYEQANSTWSHTHTFNPTYLYTDAVVDGDIVVLLDVYQLEIWEKSGSEWTNVYSAWHNGEEQDIDIDGNRVIIGETTDYWPGSPSIGQARIISKVGSTWLQEAMLVPVDTHPSDDYGTAVSISGDIACVSGTRNDGVATDGGVVAVFRRIDGIWKHTARVFASDAVEHMHFGSDVAIDSNNIVVGWSRRDNQGFPVVQGAQVSALSNYDWFNSDGGDIEVSTNWMPGLPSVKDTAQIGIPSTFTVSVNGLLPFKNLNVGTSRPTLDLQNQNVTLGSNGTGSIDIVGSRSFTGNLGIANGEITVEGNVSVGNTVGPGGLFISESSSMVVQGNYTQARSGLLQVVLGDPAVPSLEIHGNTSLAGSLALLLPAFGAEPDVGESWVVFKTLQMPEIDRDRFRVAMMPGVGNTKYFDLQYVEVDDGIELRATVESIDNLFNLEDDETVNVNGRASDLVVADFGSLAGPQDGFDDIALTINGSPGFAYLFVNDGTGSIGSQISYSAGNEPSSIDAGDLDGDNTIDLVVTNANDDTFFAIINDGGSPSNMSVGEAFTTGDVPVDVAIMNIDDDLDNELVVACSGDGALLPNGQIAGELIFYQVTPNLRIGFNSVGSVALEKPSKIDPGDVNDDKDLPFISVALAGANKAARLRKVTPLGSRGFDWEVVQEVSVGSNPQDLIMGDLDGDGDSDAVVANTGTNTLSILVTNQFGDFNDELVIEVGSGPSSIDLLDYDGDDDLDLAVIANTENDQRAIFIYRNDTSLNPTNQITFALEQIFDEGLGPILVGSGELDGDSVEDLVSIVESTGLRGGTLNSIVDIRSIPGVVTCTGDLDTDGTVGVEDLLIVIAGWGSPDADLNGDGTTDVEDILIVISAWGDCS